MSAHPRVYIAHPIGTYGTAHEATALERIAVELPGDELVNPAGRYTTNDGWRRAWPRLLASLSGVVVVPAEDGTIGTGCLREVVDALTDSLPLAVLEGDALRAVRGVRLDDERWRTRARVGTILPGRRYRTGEFAGLVSYCAEAAA